MIDRLPALSARASRLVLAAVMLCAPFAARAQRSNISVELHANTNVTAADLGLPDFPSARSYTDSGNESPVDLGFTFGDVHFRVLVSKYLTAASPHQVFDFYRKPLARYGDVLECDHGEPVGPLKITRGGLTCADSVGGKHSHVSGDFDSGHELRSGNPSLFRIVALESPHADSTQFTLLLIELPKDTGSQGTSR
ncbi:MAG TPA: hypothetical protein VGJ12_03250 [Gemmatimonadaceae bacterium]